jgi:hypothetical protein
MGQRRDRGEGKDLGGKNVASRLNSMSMNQLMAQPVKKERNIRQYTDFEADLRGIPRGSMATQAKRKKKK